MKSGFLTFATGVIIGYCVIQGLAFFQSHYLWAIFYR